MATVELPQQRMLIGGDWVAQALETGIARVNGATVHDEPQMPFGGVKASGWGRFGGRASLDEFTELRWITVAGAEGRSYPI